MKYNPVQENGKENNPKKEAYCKIKIRKDNRRKINPAYWNKYITNHGDKPCRVKMLYFEIVLYPKAYCFEHKHGM
jgi:hypothetical protein